LIEASFADAANNHHFKRARWRRLWRQQIQDYWIAAIQNIRLLLRTMLPKSRNAAAAIALTLSCVHSVPCHASPCLLWRWRLRRKVGRNFLQSESLS